MSAGLKPWISWNADASEGAVLVFAHDHAQAKRIGYAAIQGWSMDVEYIDIRARRLREHEDWLQRLANPEALAQR